MSAIRTILSRRELLWVMTLKEIQVRYKQSVLGIAWAILQPLIMMLMFTFVFSKLLGVQSGGIPYPIFSYSALMFWTLFSNSLGRAIPSIDSNAALIRKIYFPRELFPISSVLGACVDFLFTFLIFIGLMVYYRADVTMTDNILWVVPILLVQLMFTLGICFFASAINVYYRDVKFALPFIIQLWMYACPIIYPASLIPERLHTLYFMNPMASAIDSYRTVLLEGVAPNLTYLGMGAAVAILLLALGYWYFKRVEMEFADIV